MPKISIIIPAYNSEKVIKHCVNSILNQSFKDFEIIIVNDGSKDKTLGVCNKLALSDSRVKVVTKRNEGRVIARRTGYEMAQGEILAFMDHDDYLPKDAIQTLYNLMEKYQVDCVIGTRAKVFGSLPLWKKVDPISISGRVIKGDDLWEECYGLSNNYKVDDNFPGLVWGRLYRKSCIDKAMVADPDHLFSNSLCEDWWFTLISLRYMNSVYATDEIVYYWRIGGASSSDYPMLEKNNGYFNFRFDFMEKLKPKESLLMRTYVCFIKTLYWELLLKLHSRKYEDGEILEFISSQLSSQKVIDWARANLMLIPADITKYSAPVINRTPKEVLIVAYEMDSKSKMKKHVKNTLVKVYDYTCQSLENIGLIK